MKLKLLTGLILLSSLYNCTGYMTAISKGDRHYSRSLFKTAEKSYKYAIRKSPNRAEGYVKLARLYLENGRHGEALMLLQHSLHLRHPLPESWLYLATYYSNTGDHTRASFYVESALARFPKHQQLHKQRQKIGLALFIKKCNHTLQKHPESSSIRKMLGFRLMKEKYTYLALSHFDHLAEKEPNNKQLFRMLASLFLEQRNTAKAKEYLLKLLKADKKNSYALYQLGTLELDAGYLYKAYRYFYNNAKYNSNSGKAYEKLGHLTLQIGKKGKALEYLKRAYLLGRRSRKLFASIGYLYAASTDKDERKKGKRYLELAGKEIEKLKNTPQAHKTAIILNKISRLLQFQHFFQGNRKKEAEILFQLAKQYYSIQKYQEAYNYILKAYNFFPADPHYLHLKAELELQLGRFGNIQKTIVKLQYTQPGTPKLYKLKCRLYKNGPMQNNQLYLKTLKKAILASPKLPFFHIQLAQWYEKHGNITKALNAYTKARKYGANVLSKITALQKQHKLLLLIKSVSKASNYDTALTQTLKIQKLKGSDSTEYRKALKSILKRVPKFAGIHVLYGEALASAFFTTMRYSYLQQAIAHLRKALALYPGHARAALTLSKLLSFDYKGYQSINSLLKIIKKRNAFQSHSDVNNRILLTKKYQDILSNRFFTIGKILFRKNHSEHSVRYLSRSLQLNSHQTIDKLLALGKIHKYFGNYDKAVSAYKQLLKQKKLPQYRQYAIIYATLGNLYTRKVLTYPQSYQFLNNTYLKTGKELSKIVTLIHEELNTTKKLGKRAFQGYIMKNSLIIQRNMGKKKIRALDNIPTTREEVYLRIAALIRSAKGYKASIAILKTATKDLKSGKRRRILLALANQYELSGSFKKAQTTYQLLAKEYKNDWRQVYARARWELSRGKLEQSLQRFTQAASLNRHDLGLRIIIGFLKWQQGKIKDAITALDTVLKMDEMNISANYYLCKIYSQQGKFSDAEKHGNRVQELFKKNLPKNYIDRNKKEMLLDTLHTLTKVAFLQGDTLRALKYAYAGAGFDSTDSFHFLSLTGDIFFLQKKYKRAEFYYAKAVKLNPSVPFLQFKLARTYLKNAKKFLSRRILEKLYRTAQQFHKRAELMLLLASVRGQSNDPLGQENLLRQTIKEFPAFEQGYLALASLYRSKNRFSEQIQILETGLNFIKKAPNIRDAIAWYILDRGLKLTRALQLAWQNVNIKPGNANFRATYAYILFRIRKYQDSRHNISAKQISYYRKENFLPKTDTMENASEYYRIGNFREAFQLVCYPRPGIYGSKTLFTEALFSRIFLESTTIN